MNAATMKRYELLDWLLLLAYCGLIFWLSAQESLPVPNVVDYQDKFMHFGAYSIMGVFSVRAFRHSRLAYPHWALLGWLFCCLYGLSDEWHQSFVPGRSPSALDWLADSLGAGLAVAIVLKLKLWQPSQIV
jgi:VanZ family protein